MKSFKTYLVQWVRIFLGVYYLESGLNFFLRFFPQPTGSGINAEFIGVITRMHIFTGVKALDIVSGLLLLFNRYTPVALIMQFPITVQILIYDFYTPNGFGFWTGGRNFYFHVLLFFVYFRYYAPLFDPKPVSYSLSNIGGIWRNRIQGDRHAS